MREITDRSPVLILPHRDLSTTSNLDQGQGIVKGGSGGGEGGVVYHRPDWWTLLATRYRQLTTDFMTRPYDIHVLDAMRSIARAGDGLAPAEGASVSDELKRQSGWMDVTDEDPMALLALAQTDGVSPRLRVIHHPAAQMYRVMLNRSAENQEGVADLIEHGAWILSSLNGAMLGVRRILSDEGLVESVFEGARILYVPAHAQLSFPRLLPLDRSHEGSVTIHEFWMPKLGQTRGRGSPIAYKVTDTIHERLNVKDLILAIEREVAKAKAMGKTPAIALDLDGTMLNARRFAAEIFGEWLRSYQGPDADEIRRMARGSRVMQGWNSRTILRDLGIERRETLDDADSHFQKNFYNPVRRLDMPPIRGMIELVQLLMRMELATVYVTLRSKEDDNLPDGSSSSERMLRRLELWDDRSVLLRHEGEKIDWSENAYLQGGNEPQKWAMVKAFRRRRPGLFFVAVADNAPAHVVGYREFFEHRIVNIHVQGDNPPNSPAIPDAVFVVNPEKLAVDMAGWTEGCVRKGRAYAGEVLSQLSRIFNSEMSPYYADYPERHEAEIGRASMAASRTLDAVAGISPLNEIYRTFIEEINKNYAGNPGGLETFEDLMAMVNSAAGTSYAIVRGSAGVERIVSAKRGRLPDDIAVRPAPNGFRPSKISLKRAHSFEELEAVILDMPGGPDLSAPIVGDLYDMLSFGDFPRMTALLKSAAAYVAREFKKPADRLRAMEYGPRMAIGAMITLARMGVSVMWREPNELKRIQTRHELERVPEELAARISYKAPREHMKADLAVWNLPHLNTTLNAMGKKVKPKGLVIVQSAKGSKEYQKEGLSHRLMAEVMLPPGQHALPSAFLHTVPLSNMPLSLQVWKVR